MKKKIIILLSILSMFSPSTVFAEDTYATAVPAPIIAAEENTEAIMPMSDVIIWRYQMIDGKMYRRRYNKTKQQWIGEWELV